MYIYTLNNKCVGAEMFPALANNADRTLKPNIYCLKAPVTKVGNRYYTVLAYNTYVMGHLFESVEARCQNFKIRPRRGPRNSVIVVAVFVTPPLDFNADIKMNAKLATVPLHL